MPDHAIRSDENIGDAESCAAAKQARSASVPNNVIDQRYIRHPASPSMCKSGSTSRRIQNLARKGLDVVYLKQVLHPYNTFRCTADPVGHLRRAEMPF
jgi:hypothetical protein